MERLKRNRALMLGEWLMQARDETECRWISTPKQAERSGKCVSWRTSQWRDETYKTQHLTAVGADDSGRKIVDGLMSGSADFLRGNQFAGELAFRRLRPGRIVRNGVSNAGLRSARVRGSVVAIPPVQVSVMPDD